MPKKKAICFAVGSTQGLRSSDWRVWTHKNDVYFQTAPLGGVLKVSLHESGRWQMSFTSEFVKKMQAKGQWPAISRHMSRWSRPREISPGVTLAFRIIIPTSELRPLKIRTVKTITWIAAPPIGQAVEFLIFLTTPATKVTHWPGRRAMRTQFIAKLLLPNRETLWLVYRSQLVTPELRSNISHHKSSIRKSLPATDFTDPSLRSLLLGRHSDGSWYFIEVAMTTENEKERRLQEVGGPPGIVAAGLFRKLKKQ